MAFSMAFRQKYKVSMAHHGSTAKAADPAGALRRPRRQRRVRFRFRRRAAGLPGARAAGAVTPVTISGRRGSLWLCRLWSFQCFFLHFEKPSPQRTSQLASGYVKIA